MSMEEIIFSRALWAGHSNLIFVETTGTRTAYIAAEGLVCLFFSGVILAISPIAIALLLFSRNYKNPNWNTTEDG